MDSDDQILARAGLLRDIPGVIVHGRYDLCTPVTIAWDLHRAWPEAELKILADRGHFCETFRRERLEQAGIDCDFVQDNVV